VIPLRDRNPTRTRPLLTWLLIAVNTLVFVYQSSLDADSFELFVRRYGLVPVWLTEGEYSGSYITPLTSMFMHGSWLHLIANMWSLYVFGDNVEDSLGRLRYLMFYMLSGLGAALAQVAIDPSSTIPMVGASGAIAGVLGAYMRMFPRARVVTLIPILFFFLVREIPAWVFMVIWFALQVVMGVGSLEPLQAGEGEGGGVAFFAHIGGFVAGLLLVNKLRRAPNPTAGFRRP
jgi:membrane associated rhomboid family serine protease